MATTGLRRPLALCFSGSGHLLCYHLGVAQHVLRESSWAGRVDAFVGTSGGAIAAAACALLPEDGSADVRLVDSAVVGDAFGQLARELSPGGAVAPSALTRANGRLFLGATECETSRRALLSQFGGSAETLLTCVLASCAIPKSAHPFDLLFRASPPRYPSRDGIFVPLSCEHDGGASARKQAAPAHAPAEWEAGVRAYVDGGLSAALPLPPEELGLDVLTVSPLSGPRQQPGPARRMHLCPDDRSARIPGWAPALAGLRVYVSLGNVRAAASAGGAPPAVLRSWYDRGRADAEEFVTRMRNTPTHDDDH